MSLITEGKGEGDIIIQVYVSVVAIASSYFVGRRKCTNSVLQVRHIKLVMQLVENGP